MSELPQSPQLDGFAFLRYLDHGHWGEVWLATDLVLQVQRAVKLLRTNHFTAAAVERLVEEARLMASLPKHRNRVQVYGLFPTARNCFLVMDYVEGGSLSKHPERPLPWAKAARYVGDVADGLAEVHAAGILHRDIKPSNILHDVQRDEALLADFGIAARAGQAGGIAGTPGYIAPELDGGAASPRSDVFSLAATLFCLIAGRAPFAAGDVLTSIEQARVGLRRPVTGLERVPRAIEEVILVGLEPQPDRRIDLDTFTARLRGAHLQALADKLLEMSRRSASPVHLRVSVAAAKETDLVFRPIPAETRTEEPTRDRSYVPEPAPVFTVPTGNLLRFEITADADGYLTVLNLGSSGVLKVIFPNPLARDNRIRAGQAHRLTVKLTPPPGIDRAAVIWTRHPNLLTPAEWVSRIEAGQPTVVPPTIATRGMDFVLHEAEGHAVEGWTAAVVTVAHRPS
jgi:serine/threonine protein kinase